VPESLPSPADRGENTLPVCAGAGAGASVEMVFFFLISRCREKRRKEGREEGRKGRREEGREGGREEGGRRRGGEGEGRGRERGRGRGRRRGRGRGRGRGSSSVVKRTCLAVLPEYSGSQIPYQSAHICLQL